MTDQVVSQTRKAVVLVSGGLDSATVIAMALDQGFEVYALSFDYGQRHSAELEAARRVVASQQISAHQVFKLDLSQFGGSALTDTTLEVPDADTVAADEIPITYVPARNTVFLSIALAWAEVLDAPNLFIGVNAVDYSGYPDCRPEFIRSFEATANLATRLGVEQGGIKVHMPLVDLTKAQIIQAGTALGVDYALTVSCYQADQTGAACGRCDSCVLRRAGFEAAGVADPTRYYE